VGRVRVQGGGVCGLGAGEVVVGGGCLLAETLRVLYDGSPQGMMKHE